MNEKRDECRILRGDGKSIREIAKLVGLSSTTVRYHTKDVIKGCTNEIIVKDKPLLPSYDLAYFWGVFCGDGYLSFAGRYPTTVLGIVCDTRYPKLIERYINLLINLTHKKPSVRKRNKANCIDIKINGQYFSDLFQIPIGAKCENYPIPQWIFDDYEYCRLFVKGLMETDGSIQHLSLNSGKTFAYQASFTQKNKSIMNAFLLATKKIGFNFKLGINGTTICTPRARICGDETIKLMDVIGLHEKLRKYQYDYSKLAKKIGGSAGI